MQVIVLGLGKMGTRIAKKLSTDHEVIVWNRTPDAVNKFIEDNPKAKALSELSLISAIQSPRIIWLMLPAGEPTVEMLYELKKNLEKGDVIIDGGNAYWKDTDKRYLEFDNIGISFLGIGVSGGIFGEKEGYPLMVGGSEKGFEKITPLLETLSKPFGGFEYFGEGGAGHFVKMVHNGVEYGMMQSIGEGFEILHKSPFKINVSKVAKLWARGSIVSGFLMNRTADALSKNPNLNDIVGVIDASGEAQWTVEAAKDEGVDAEIIEKSLEYRLKSQDDKKIQNSFGAKLIAALRREFGGHSVTKK
jgi:6-phosphogluconate dehydrogenase